MHDRQLIDRAAVARMLGMTVEKFYKRYADLHAHKTNPFPGPVLGSMSGSRWDPLAITRWIDAGGEHPPPPTSPPPAPAGAATPDSDRERRKAERRRRAAELAEAG
ncbi:MAG TPA: hypothetical protein VLL76_08660 [Candidatus Omnitrophota bacterium]|nr:hypothetical protein [Candidatus Omnitrophota bacterium]